MRVLCDKVSGILSLFKILKKFEKFGLSRISPIQNFYWSHKNRINEVSVYLFVWLINI